MACDIQILRDPAKNADVTADPVTDQYRGLWHDLHSF